MMKAMKIKKPSNFLGIRIIVPSHEVSCHICAWQRYRFCKCFYALAAYHSGTIEFTLSSCYSIFNIMCMFCRSVFILLYFFFWPLCCLFFFFWPLCCLFFFDIPVLLITPLVSSNSSYFISSRYLVLSTSCD